MFKLTSDIQVGNYQYNGVVDLEHESSWDNLTDKCTLTFPRRVEWDGKNIAFGDAPLIQRGNKVVVGLGYDFQNKTVFEGYVHQIHAQTPVEVECQDAAWLLKQSTKTISYKDVTLQKLLTDILPEGMVFEVNDLSLGSFRISKASPAEVLEKIKKTYFQKSFFRGGKLYCGLAYVPSLQNTHTVKFERNVVDSQLQYLRKEDVRVKLKAISMLPNNKKIEVEVGDPDGEQRTLHQYNVSEKVLRAIAEQEVEEEDEGIEWEDDMPAMNNISTSEDTFWKIIDEETGKENMDIDWRFKQGDLVKIRIFLCFVIKTNFYRHREPVLSRGLLRSGSHGRNTIFHYFAFIE